MIERPAPVTPNSAPRRRRAAILAAVVIGAITLSTTVADGAAALEVSFVAQQDNGGSGDDGLSTEEWVLLILLGIAALAIVIGVTAAATGHADRRNAQQRNLGARLRDITAGCRWVNDQAVPSVLQATTVDRLNSTWLNARGHMVQLEGKIAALAAGTGDGRLDESLSSLGQSLAGLRGAVEQNAQLRLRPDAANQQTAILASSQTVTQRRVQLDNALVPVLAARP